MKKGELKKTEENSYSLQITAEKGRNWDKDNSYLQFSSVIFSY